LNRLLILICPCATHCRNLADFDWVAQGWIWITVFKKCDCLQNSNVFHIHMVILTLHSVVVIVIVIIIINCNWAYAWWQCYKNWTYIQKKWTYIARKQNRHLTTKQHIHLTKKQHISQNFTVQYKCNEQNTRYNKSLQLCFVLECTDHKKNHHTNLHLRNHFFFFCCFCFLSLTEEHQKGFPRTQKKRKQN
jgi:hypothetical protein